MAAGDATKYALRVRRAHSSSSNLARILRIPTGRVLTKGLPLGLQMSGSEGKSAPKSGFCRSGLHFQPIHTGRSRKGTPPIIYPVVYTVVVARGACRRSRRRVSSFAAAPFGSAAITPYRGTGMGSTHHFCCKWGVSTGTITFSPPIPNPAGRLMTSTPYLQGATINLSLLTSLRGP